MLLQPDDNGKVEIAVLNMPAFVPPASANNEVPQVGKHFEMYYELTDNPPSKKACLVPQAGAAPGAPSYPTVSWASIHPHEQRSELLNKLRLDVGRGPYDRILCPPFAPLMSTRPLDTPRHRRAGASEDASGGDGKGRGSSRICAVGRCSREQVTYKY